MSDSTSVVSEGKVVALHYTLKGDNGEVIESSEGKDPLVYLHGASRIVPGLEKALEGHGEGEQVEAVVPPEEGYGPKTDAELQEVPRSEFPDGVDFYEGMMFTAQGQGGQEIPLWVDSFDDETVTVDPHHPMAGKTLHFDVEIVKVRDASDEEIAHGHAHGIDGQGGHHH